MKILCLGFSSMAPIHDHNEDFMSWVFKYGTNPRNGQQIGQANGRLTVNVKGGVLELPIKNASVHAWKYETSTWYDIQPEYGDSSICSRNDLPEGEYLLRAYMEGYKAQEATIIINAGEETTYTFTLESATSRPTTLAKCPISNFLIQILEKLMDNFPVLARILQFQIQTVS